MEALLTVEPSETTYGTGVRMMYKLQHSVGDSTFRVDVEGFAERGYDGRRLSRVDLVLKFEQLICGSPNPYLRFHDVNSSITGTCDVYTEYQVLLD